MNPVIIVQARMASTRLPGKVLKPVLEKSLLEYQLERLKRVSGVSQVVLATSEQEIDQPIVDFGESQGVTVVRGPEHDVLARYYQAALYTHADPIIRVTADCPLIDPVVITQVLDFYLKNQPTYAYVSNVLERTYPVGMDTEVFSFQSLSDAYHQATDLDEREHVTPFIYRRPKQYPLSSFTRCDEPNLAEQAKWRLTVDTSEDFELIQKLIEALYPSHPELTLQDLIHCIEEHPDWLQLNAHVVHRIVQKNGID